MNLTTRILIGMGAGILLGMLFNVAALAPEHWAVEYLLDGVLTVGGSLFIASLKVMVVPLVFVSLICGASSLSEGTSMGRLGGKTLGLYLLTTAMAISMALTLALFIAPGERAGDVEPVDFQAAPAPDLAQVIIDLVPTNPVAALAEGKMLQIIVFAILLGVAIARAGESGERIRGFFNDVNTVLMNLITMLIALAPYGVFCLMTTLFADVGWNEIFNLGYYFLTVVLGLAIHVSLVYPTLLAVVAGVSPRKFFAKMREPMLVAFSTASSGATLPVTLRTVEKRLGVDNEVASFVVPLGATINMDGTAIMQGVATVFIAQFYGVDLVMTDYLMIVLTATMASIGTAAVPGVGLIMLTMVLTQVGLPVEGIMLIIGVDRLLDMMRTAVNVSGDGTVATLVGRSENRFNESIFLDPNAGRVRGAR